MENKIGARRRRRRNNDKIKRRLLSELIWGISKVEIGRTKKNNSIYRLRYRGEVIAFIARNERVIVNFRAGELARNFRGEYYNWGRPGNTYRDIFEDLVRKKIKKEYEKQKKNKNKTKRRLLNKLFDSSMGEENPYFNDEMPWNELGKNNNSFIRIVNNEKIVIHSKHRKLFPMDKNEKNDFLVLKCINLYNEIAPQNEQYNGKIKNMEIANFNG